MGPIRIATRSSELARWQAQHVADAICRVRSDIQVVLVPVSTEGDRRLDVPLSAIGGKAVFAKEVQTAVLDGRAELAVHSAKDLAAVEVDSLVIGAVPPRGDARDALVGCALSELGEGSVVGTGSARRRALLAAERPGTAFAELRGNMATRLAQVEDLDAIVVAAVALQRLGNAERISETLDPARFVPQVGQGALAVECRADDRTMRAILAGIDHAPSRRVLEAERAFLAELGGDCSIPAGAHATMLDNGALRIRAVLAARDGSGSLQRSESVAVDGVAAGRALARELMERVTAEGGAA